MVAADLVVEELQVVGKKENAIEIPQWATQYINAEGAKKIESVVEDLEHKTTAELIPLIVQRSTPVRTVRRLVFFFLFMIGLLIVELSLANFWLSTTERYLIIAAAFIIPLIGLSQYSHLERFFLSPEDMQDSVNQRAVAEFYLNQMHKTESQGAVLFMVSLFEHRAIVLADPILNDKVAPELWAECATEIVKGAKAKDLSAGLIKAMEISTKKLSEVLPHKAGQTNEFSNRVLFKF